MKQNQLSNSSIAFQSTKHKARAEFSHYFTNETAHTCVMRWLDALKSSRIFVKTSKKIYNLQGDSSKNSCISLRDLGKAKAETSLPDSAKLNASNDH
jgi:hypothetical protein